MSVQEAGDELKVRSENKFGEKIFATPALAAINTALRTTDQGIIGMNRTRIRD